MTVGKRILLTALLLGSMGLWAGGVFADSFIVNGEKLLDGRVNTRGATDGDVMKYDATTMQWSAAADDTGAGGVATNDTASAVLIGTGSGWAQETDAKIDSSGTLTTTGNLITTNGYVQVNRNGDTADAILLITGDAGEKRGLIVRTGTNIRWKVHASDTAESGSNAGSHFDIERFSDAGVYIDTPLRILRDTGQMNVGNGLALTGSLSVNGDSYIYDDKYLAFGSDANIRLEYDETTDDKLKIKDSADSVIGTLTEAGALELVDFDATNDIDVGDDLRVVGLATVGETLEVTTSVTSADLISTDDVTVGDDLVVTGLATVGDTLDVTGLASLDGGIDVDGTLTVDGSTGVLTTSALANLDGGFKIDTDKLVVTDAGVITSQAGITALGLVLGTTENFGVTAAGVLTTDALANLDGGIAVDTNKFTVSAAGAVVVADDLSVGGVVKQTIRTFTASDATPDVSSGNVFNADNTAAVTITNLDNAVVGQTITIIGTHSSNTATFTDGATFYLGATRVLQSQDVLVLLCDSVSPNRFIEISYSDNS